MGVTVRQRKLSTLGLGLAGALLAGTLLPGVASAAAGDASARGVVIDLAGGIRGTVLVDADAVVGAADAPAGGGTDSDTVADIAAAVTGAVGVTATGSVDVTATREPTGSRASATVTGLTLGVLGIPAIGAGELRAAVDCPQTGALVADTTLTGLTLFGDAVTLDAGTPTVTATSAVTVPGVPVARLRLTVSRVETVTEPTATAVAVRATLALDVGTGGGLSVRVPLGTVTLASATCQRPAAAPAAPTATGITPDTGPTAGGQTVTITGTGFVAGTTVTFDGVPATGVVVAPGRYVADRRDPGARGGSGRRGGHHPGRGVRAARLHLRRGAGSAGADGDGDRPGLGADDGWDDGDDHRDGPGRYDGGDLRRGPGDDREPDRHLCGGAYAGACGGSGRRGGDHPGWDRDACPAPSPTSRCRRRRCRRRRGITPDTGPTAGGQTVTITGTGFVAGTTVTFDGVAATNVVVAADCTSLTARTPANAAGPAVVVVTTPGGSAAPLAYTYVAPGGGVGGDVDGPTLDAITPDRGPTTGGQTVVITGSGFTDGTTVTFDGVPATSVAVVDGDTLIVRTPPGVAGPADVVVTVDGVASDPLTYTYVAGTTIPAAPTADVLDPETGPAAGGTSVTVTGSGFVPGQTSVIICGTTLLPADVEVASGTSLSFTTPACAVGPTDVVVVTPGGVTAALGFTYTDGTGVGGANGDGSGSDAGDSLPNTGADVRGVALLGVALLVGGAALTGLARRRRVVATD